MDVPHPVFNHSDHPPYRISEAPYARPNQSLVGATVHVERVHENLTPGPDRHSAQHSAPSVPYGMSWVQRQQQQHQHFNPKVAVEDRNQDQHGMKDGVHHNQVWPTDMKSPIRSPIRSPIQSPTPESKRKAESRSDTPTIELAEEEVVSNFVPLSWAKSPKPHTATKAKVEANNGEDTKEDDATKEQKKEEEELAVMQAFMSIEPSGFTCIQCGHVVHRSQLAKHIRMHTADRPFKCDVCKRAFRQKSNLIVHMRMHTGELPFKCEFCDKAFRQKSILVTHIRTHTREMPYKCHLCPKAFTQKSNLVEHIRVHTGEKPYRCPECEKAFAQKSNLVVHIRSHTGEAPFKCGACGKAFRQKSILTTHMRTHTGELPFKCQQCDRAFAQKSNLVERGRQHTGERPFVCQECEKAFIRHQDLLQHTRHHTGRKPYDCVECGKMFSRKKHAEKHFRSHMKHRFNCGVCGQGFMDENLMVIHLTTHCHCHICGISFDSKDDLTEHCRLHALGLPDSAEIHANTVPSQGKMALIRNPEGSSTAAPFGEEKIREFPSNKSYEPPQTNREFSSKSYQSSQTTGNFPRKAYESPQRSACARSEVPPPQGPNDGASCSASYSNAPSD